MLIFLLGCIITIYTSKISSNQCPSNFNISLANTSTDSSYEYVQTTSYLYDNYNTNTVRNMIDNLLLTGSTAQILRYISHLYSPYIFAAVVSLMLFGSILIYWAYSHYKKQQPGCQKRIYLKTQLRYIAILATIGYFLLLSPSFYSFILMPVFKERISYSKCAFYLWYDTFLNGNPSYGWSGISNLNTTINQISSNLISTKTSANQYFVNNSWLIDNLNDLFQLNNQLFVRYNSSQLISPNTQLNTYITPSFIEYNLGPIDDNQTLVGSVYQGLQSTQAISELAFAVGQSALVFSDSISIVQDKILSSQQLFQIEQSDLTQFYSTLSNVVQNKIFNSLGWQVYVIQAFCTLVIAGSILGFMGVIGTHLIDVQNCRSIVHLTWILFGISYASIFYYLYLLIPLNSINYQICNTYNQILSDINTFSTYQNSDSNFRLFGHLQNCIFNQGNFLNEFSLEGESATLQNIFYNISQLNQITNPLQPNYVHLDQSQTLISNWVAAILNYRDGIYIDYNISQNSGDNPYYAINTLNTLLSGNSTNNQSNCVNDYWVYNIINCSLGQLFYQHGNDSTNGLSFTSQPFCISFNQAINSTQFQSGFSWSQSDFSQRYLQIAQNCTFFYNDIITYGYNIIQYRQSRKYLYQSIAHDLQVLSIQNQGYNSNLSAFLLNVSLFLNQTSNMSNLITNQINGLNVSSNCSIVNDQLQFIYNAYCINLMETMIKLAHCMILLAIVLPWTILAGFIFAFRYSTIDTQKIQKNFQNSKDIDSDIDTQQG